MRIAGNSNSAVDKSPDECPKKPWHMLRPTSHDLQAESYAIDIGTIIANNAEGKDDQAELAKAT